jgi:hypothetical protein
MHHESATGLKTDSGEISDKDMVGKYMADQRKDLWPFIYHLTDMGGNLPGAESEFF